ncbi:MAG: hypothetical protein PHI05_05155 [Bacilli bacterium]|nr:hypothetical protein [Bacilli bacterium]MDD4548105.1 hypothetical protein [Bacilli bacterium]
MEFIIIGAIILYILEVNRQLSTKKFINDTEPYFRFLMEDDYQFLATIKYGADVDINKLYTKRVQNGLVVIIMMIFVFLTKLNFISIVLSVIVGYISFKAPYSSLKAHYKNNLHHINLMLPYYLKSLEILIQHYTVPVALTRSISTAPDIFKPGLHRLIAKIESGDGTVDPYMDFAKEYPVRDSMRMMRLLYRLGLGSQENKQEQLMMFSKTVSSLQNKSREQKYKERLEKMESKTMVMLGATGSGILLLMLMSMMMMMQI